jgi:hypothetical protein
MQKIAYAIIMNVINRMKAQDHESGFGIASNCGPGLRAR